jgi:hypothetical protein
MSINEIMDGGRELTNVTVPFSMKKPPEHGHPRTTHNRTAMPAVVVSGQDRD